MSLQELFAAMARETEALAERSARIDAAIGARGAAADPALQDIDLLRQSLEDLSRFACLMARQADPAQRIDPRAAAAGLRLGALRRRLAGKGEAADAAASGEVDLF